MSQAGRIKGHTGAKQAETEAEKAPTAKLTNKTAGENVQRSLMDNVTTVPTNPGETDALIGKTSHISRRRGAIR